MEDSGLSLDPERKDEYTDETDGKEGKHDPEGSVARIGRVKQSDIRRRLPQHEQSRCLNGGKEQRQGVTYEGAGGQGQVPIATMVMVRVRVVRVVRVARPAGGTDRDGAGRLVLEVIHDERVFG